MDLWVPEDQRLMIGFWRPGLELMWLKSRGVCNDWHNYHFPDGHTANALSMSSIVPVKQRFELAMHKTETGCANKRAQIKRCCRGIVTFPVKVWLILNHFVNKEKRSFSPWHPVQAHWVSGSGKSTSWKQPIGESVLTGRVRDYKLN